MQLVIFYLYLMLYVPQDSVWRKILKNFTEFWEVNDAWKKFLTLWRFVRVIFFWRSGENMIDLWLLASPTAS